MYPFKTTYRLAVMGVTLAIVVMGWRLYGPPATKVKSMALQAIEWTEGLLRSPADKPATPTVQTPPVRAQQTLAASATATPPALIPAVAEAPVFNTPTSPPIKPVSDLAPSAMAAQNVPPTSAGDRLQSLLSRLAELDVQEPQLVPWGSSGRLYRCCCRASWGQSAQFSRHFEAVAEEPQAAVDEVAAQVAAWRRTEQVVR